MMLACCVPMLLIAFALVASGTAGAGAILFALLCAAMMAAMMFAMPDTSTRPAPQGYREVSRYPR